MTEATTRSYLPLWILIAVTILPFLGAWIVFFNPSLLGGMETSNRGELVTPPRPAPSLALETLDGSGLDSDALAGHWTLLTVAGSGCGERCQTNLFHMRQARLAMGEERHRVRRILLLRDAVSTTELGERLLPFEGTIVVTGPDSERDRLLSLLAPDADQPADERIFLIDPQGQLMMAYPPVPGGADVVKDLERLIQVVRQ